MTQTAAGTSTTGTGTHLERKAGAAVRGLLGGLGSAVRLVTGAFAAVLALHILLTVFGANPDHGITRFFTGLADALTLGLRDLFVLASPTLQVVVSYGLPALAWLIIGSVVGALLRAIARPRSGLR